MVEEAVRDDERRAVLRDFRELRLDRFLGVRIERGRRLVEDEDRRVLEERARDRHALLLAAGELEAALAHRALPLHRQALDEFRDVRDARRALDSSRVASGRP
jgi:hypothetical protein